MKQIAEKAPKITLWTIATLGTAYVANRLLIEFLRMEKMQLDLEAITSPHPATRVIAERHSRYYDDVITYLQNFDPIHKVIELSKHYFGRNGNGQY